jgi:hypothetical protein
MRGKEWMAASVAVELSQTQFATWTLTYYVTLSALAGTPMRPFWITWLEAVLFLWKQLG